MSATNSVGARDALVEVVRAVLLVGFEVLFDDVEELQAASASIVRARAATLRERVIEAIGDDGTYLGTQQHAPRATSQAILRTLLASRSWR